MNRLRDVLNWLICLEPLYVAINGLKNDDPHNLDEINGGQIMLACLDPIDDLCTSDANDVLRTPAVIRTSNRRDCNIILYFRGCM